MLAAVYSVGWALGVCALTLGLGLATMSFVSSAKRRSGLPEGSRLPPVWTSGIPLLGPFIAFAGDPLGTVSRARKACGNVFTISLLGERCTFLVGAEAHEVFFAADDEELDQAPVYKFMTPIFGKGIIYDSPLPQRRQQMRHLGSSLKPSELRRYPAIIAKEAHDYFADKWGESGQIDLLPSMAELTIMTASSTLLGPEVRNQMFHELSELFHMLDNGLTPLSVFFPYAPTAAHAGRDKARKGMGELFGKIIRARRAEEEAGQKKVGRIDLVQKLMDFKYKDGTKLKEDEIAGMMVATLFAGQHTSSVTATWTVLFLLDDARKGGNQLARVMEELEQVAPGDDDGLEGGTAAFARGEGIDHTTIQAEKHMHACVKEAIRMFPPLIFLMRRVVKAQTTATGIHIPAGDRVMVSNAVAQRLPEVFPNPDTYDPDRWTSFDIKSLPKYSFIGFGAGVHTCMGESFAFMQLRTILSVLFSMYDLEAMNELPTADYEAMVVPPKGPNMVRYQRRKVASSSSSKKKKKKKAKAPNAAAVPYAASTAAAAADDGSAVYTMAEVAKHSTKDDCWIVVEGKVYEVTNYLDVHQGGDLAIINFGGKDATDAVNGPQHPSTVPILLERFQIGRVVS